MRTRLITATLGASIVIVAAAGGVGPPAHGTSSGGPSTPRAVSSSSAVFVTADSAPATARVAPVVLKGCDAFSTQAEASSYLKVTPAAQPNLDTDGDGVACEAKFAPPKPSSTVSATNETNSGPRGATHPWTGPADHPTTINGHRVDSGGGYVIGDKNGDGQILGEDEYYDPGEAYVDCGKPSCQ